MSIQSFFGELIIQDTVVLETVSKGIKVALNPSCDDAISCQGCTQCSTSKNITKFFVSTANRQNFSVGTKIRVKIFSPHKLVSVFFVFILPILFIIGTMTAWYFIQPEQAESGLAVGSALIAGMVGFLLNAFVEKGFRMMYPPHIVQKEPSS